ncbi:hypothetical protein [Rhodococcus erythropolis]|uniref:hypothetical protein n=1 Tax=Rhodococcus erythropolis TaxID=1833 RepID=UPI001BE943BB|nr:hypothetical protein [Rhodococcus erythropolis]MBT2266432.1 hypothetical protein [Rhodococcus erythropolis]
MTEGSNGPTLDQLWGLIHYQSRTLSEIEDHCRLRVQDWGDRSAQEVLDIINQEGEWAVDE